MRRRRNTIGNLQHWNTKDNGLSAVYGQDSNFSVSLGISIKLEWIWSGWGRIRRGCPIKNIIYVVMSNRSNALRSSGKRACQWRCTPTWTYIFSPGMPGDLVHLHSTGLNAKVSGRVKRFDAAYNVHLPGSRGVLLSEASVNVYREGQESTRKFHLFGHIWTPFCCAMNDPCEFRISLRPDRHNGQTWKT